MGFSPLWAKFKGTRKGRSARKGGMGRKDERGSSTIQRMVDLTTNYEYTQRRVR